MKSNIKWVLFFSALCIVCVFVWIFRSNSDEGSKIAVIKKNGEVIKNISLSDIEESYEFDISDDLGRNILRAENGRIAVIDADCPDKICVSQGYIENGMIPIVCLPHKLSVEIVGEKNNEADAVAGGN